MAKSKAMIIGGPMDAKHLGGANVTFGAQPSIVESYFLKTMLEPDELPSHTLVAQGNIEILKRSDTIASTIRRPSVSIKRGLSKLRTASISHIPELHRKVGIEVQNATPIARSKSTKANKPLKMQPSMSRLRQKVGLDKNLHAHAPMSKAKTPEPEIAPKPLQKDYPPLRLRQSISRLMSRSASSTSEPEAPHAGHFTLRSGSTALRKSTMNEIKHQPVERKPSRVPKRAASKAQPPTRPKRADSGTAIELDDVPIDKRPLGFKDILAIQSFADRMQHYRRAREYWAHVDHGLKEWNEGVSGSRTMKMRS